MKLQEQVLITHEYDFIGKQVTLSLVKQIIAQAGYNSGDYQYKARVGGDGFVVSGSSVMNINRLENAAKALKIKVEISSPSALESLLQGARALATPYKVTINMDTKTVQALSNGNYQLYGFKAVKTTLGGGAPLVWFQTTDFSTGTNVSWSESYQAFTSSSTAIANGQVTASFSVDADLGDTLEVTDKTGIGEVQQEGPSDAISIHNNTNVPFTTGISQMVNGDPNPLCAFPLYGGGLNVIVPIEKVLFMFSTVPMDTGTVIEKSYTPSILIDLTGAPGNCRTVTFDINNGWSWGGYNWAHQYPAKFDLVPLLIDNS